ncbi:hypothetical protein LI82_03445 [Methanococcoides methylutens]|uniref:Uncharacterized protein n=1 Tax=Methanococcoides methylutens TaxID=2226 RepID=A0A099T1U3_METMT|nr:hypothetical protein LI82_03445 [Methanococcoides methylutens]
MIALDSPNEVPVDDVVLKRTAKYISQRSRPHQIALCLRMMHISFPDGVRFSFGGIKKMFITLKLMGFDVDVINLTFAVFKSYRGTCNSSVSKES